VFVAALLIREGLMSIHDLFDHVSHRLAKFPGTKFNYWQLSPSGEEMDALRQKHEDEMKKRIRLAKTTAADKENALASAPVLSQSDDRDFGSRRPPPPSQTTQASAPVKPIKEPRVLEELNQHRDLAVALLSVGALRPALFLTTMHPWLVSRYPQLADILLKQLEYSIEPVYRSFSPKTKEPEAAQVYSKALKNADGGKLPKTKLTMTFPVPPASGDIQQVFFFQQWMERIPVSQTTEEMQLIVDPMLRIVGVHAYRCLPLFLKLCRIARHEYANEVRLMCQHNAIRT
jgi:THO complex subunit 2